MTRLRRWERLSEWPLTAAALLFLAAYAAPIIQPELPRPWPAVCELVTWVTWAVFVAEFAVRLLLAEQRGRWLLHHVFDLLVIVLPLLRPLRLLRLATLLSVLNRRASTNLRGRVVIYVVGGALLLAFCGALVVLDAERGSPQANITSFGDALWWAVTTMTSVGYGDRFPTTTAGRWAASGLMIAGLALIGAVSATLASWLVEHVTDTEEAQTVMLERQLGELQAQLAELRSLVAAQSPTAPPARGTAAD